ncbi:MAG TPA: glycosyltransferase family 39 protein [Candidatus Acidoferrum sp.]|nr:glycosyltransferase family 39 protein [Candidatus Acidoferrum sp.]
MNKRFVDILRSDLGVLILIAVIRVALHTATNGQYGFHRDELQTLDDARHLDWGFVAYPPVTPLLGGIELMLFGTSLAGFRFLASVAVSIVMVLAGLIAKELGGSRHIQVLAAMGTGIAPISLVQGAVFQYVSFDYLWGVSATYFLVRLVKSEDPRWWLAVGAMLGLGMESRYTMGFLALGIAGAALLTSARRYLFSRWLWAGVGLSVLIFLPNIIWQVRHHLISLDFLAYLHARDLRQGRYSGFCREQFFVSVNVVTAPLAILGLWFYLVREEGKRYRLLGWTFIVTFALFALAGARSYYTAPIYPMLIAAGSVLLGDWLAKVRPSRARAIYGTQWGGIVVSGTLAICLVIPLAPIGSRLWKITSKAHDQFREEIGWQDLAENVAKIYFSLPPEERAKTGILTGNYGEGGALNLYGAGLGLPHAMSLTNSFWLRGYDPREPQIVIVAGFDLEEGAELFETCVTAGKNTNPYGVVNEESRDHPDILLCRNLRVPWPVYWAKSRRFG